MRQRKIMKKLLYALPIVPLLLCSCFQGRPINYPFNDVSAALKQKFTRADKQSFEYTAPKIEDSPGYFYLYFEKNLNFFKYIKTEIKLKKDSEKTSKIMIRINEHNRQWNYSMRQEDKEQELYDKLVRRLATGKWESMSWERKKFGNLKKDEL